MRVEIEVSEEEAAELVEKLPDKSDGWYAFQPVLARIVAALPRELQVGDIVEVRTRGGCRAVVLAIEGKCAWCGFNSVGEPFTELLSALTLMPAKSKR